MKYVKKAIPVEACALDGNHDEWLKDAIKKTNCKDEYRWNGRN